VHAQPSSAACDPLELHSKAHTQCGATRRPWKAMEGHVSRGAPNRGVSCLSRAVERGIVSDLRRSQRRKRAHRPGQLPRACRHDK